MRSTRYILMLLIFVIYFLGSCTKQVMMLQQEPQAKPANLILIIGDGMGIAHLTSHFIQHGKSVFQQIPEVALVSTHSADNIVTDSAAGATAMATGEKTKNLHVGVDKEGNKLKTIMDLAQEANMSTGVVTTASVLDATPASFYAHAKNRYWLDTLAKDLLHCDIDIMIGGGKQFFDDTMEGSPIRIEDFENAGFEVNDFFSIPVNRINPKSPKRQLYFNGTESALLHTLGKRHLSEASEKAIKYLNHRSQNGFFLLVEGAQIDWASHARKADELHYRMHGMEMAVKTVLDWARNDGNTLVIVTADHSTGGLAILEGSKPNNARLDFSTNGHTGSMVPIFAFGPGAQVFEGIMDNTDIYYKMKELLNLYEDNTPFSGQ